MSESLVGRQNPYVCPKCWRFTNTIHVDDGVTPFMLGCRATPGCKGMATSAFYPKGPRPPHIPEPTWEWYSPNAQELATLKTWERHHVEQGGVLLRPLSPSTRERFPDVFAAPPPSAGTPAVAPPRRYCPDCEEDVSVGPTLQCPRCGSRTQAVPSAGTPAWSEDVPCVRCGGFSHGQNDKGEALCYSCADDREDKR